MLRLFSVCLLATALLVQTGCRDDDDDGNNNQNNSTTDNTIYQVQDPAHAQHLQAGDSVALEEVVVTAVDTYGDRTGNITVQEPQGGAYSGVLVFSPTIAGGSINDIHVGDLVDVDGTINEFSWETDTSGRSLTEIEQATVTLIGQGTPATPEVVSAQYLNVDPNAEQWEGVLVTAQNVRVIERFDSYEEVNFTGGLTATSDLFDAYGAAVDDQCYAEVTGVMSYFFKYFIMPRSAADLVTGNSADCASSEESICDDNQDNDGDGWTDCDDHDCSDEPYCRETDCDDNNDNDGDGLTDCDDDDCDGSIHCPLPVENTNALCDNNTDDDGDGLTDCDDPSCFNHPDVTACQEQNCTDGLDNDGDGHTDCDDNDCVVNATATCDASEEVGDECNNNIDDDGDGYEDCADISCRLTYAGCKEIDCFNSVDDDDDGHTDCDDFDCQYAGVCPNSEVADATCMDGIDNDSNGYTDCRDFSCQRSPLVTYACEGNAVTCSDGIDNDGNGYTDCEDFACMYCQGSNPYSADTCPLCPD